MFSNKLNYKLFNITLLMLLLYIGFSNIGLWWMIITKVLSILSPFIVAFIFSYVFAPVVSKLEEKGVRKWLAVLFVILCIVSVVSLLLIILLPMIYDQLVLFAKMTLEVLQDVGDRFDLNLGNFEIKIFDYLNEIIKNIGGFLSSTTVGFLSKSIDFVSKFVVGFVSFIYFLIYMDSIKSGIKNLLLSINKRLFNYIKLLNNDIGQYLYGLGIFMIVQFIEYSFLFFIVGHPNWLILGILASLTTVIPYFGGLITNIIAIITASVVSTKLFIATIIICLIFPQLDGYVISPKIYGKTNNVNPLITIMAVSIGGTIAGVIGIIVSLPIYIFIRTTYYFFKKDLKKSMKKMKNVI